MRGEIRNMPENFSFSRKERVTWWRKLTLEDIGTTLIVIVGIMGGLLIRVLGPNLEPFYSAIFLGLGTAAFVYRFLGGISQSTSITIVGFKLGGSLAALIAVTFVFNNIITEQRDWIPPENLILSFYKGNHPIEKHITVKIPHRNNPYPEERGQFILPFKDLKASDTFLLNIKGQRKQGQ